MRMYIRIAAWSNYSSGPTPCYAAPPTCTNESHPKCVDHPLPTGSRIRCMGSRDYRPTPPGVPTPDGYAIRSPARADALALENAHGVRLRNVTFEFEMPRHDWFGDCVSIDRRSANLTGIDAVRCINGPSAQSAPPVLTTLSSPAMASVPSATLSVEIDGSVVVHELDERFVSFTMDTGRIADGYDSADLESPDVITLASALGPAYLRLSGGKADSLGYRRSGSGSSGSGSGSGSSSSGGSDSDSGSRSPVHSVSSAAPPSHCVGSDCGNCDEANSPGGPPVVAMAPPNAWFNESSWQRINSFAAATGLHILFGLNGRARAATDSPWDGRHGMAELINWTASQPLSQYPVVGYQVGGDDPTSPASAHHSPASNSRQPLTASARSRPSLPAPFLRS
jgi:hypothetical protein